MAKRVCLAYSGGLDTSVILRWLIESYGCEVVAYCADVGQEEELLGLPEKAKASGAVDCVIRDLREEFVSGFVFPALQANAIYEGSYLLGTALARPVIARHQVQVARELGCDALAHGATGKGNDQVRFELAIHALSPRLRVVAPWREWDLTSRERLLAYADAHGIPVERGAGGGAPYSTDANLLHISYEGGALEDPWTPPPPDMWRRTVHPQQAPAEAETVEVDFAAGDPVTVNGEALSPAAMLERLNQLGGRHGIGRIDIVENRYAGMKSRGCYETPGGTILHKARRAMESLTMDREAAHLKDELMPRYASLVYNGYWFSPERELLQSLVDESQKNVNGTVRLVLYKGSVTVSGRKSESDSLFDESIATFEDDAGAFDQGDAEGFIKLNALRLRIAALRRGG